MFKIWYDGVRETECVSFSFGLKRQQCTLLQSYIFNVIETTVKKIICILSFFCALKLNAQEVEGINSDRPDQSEGVYILPKNKFQIEGGGVIRENIFSNDIMLRYGLFRDTEIRLSSDFEKNKREGYLVDNVTTSFKQRLLQEKNFFPSVTLVGYLAYVMPSQRWTTDFCIAFENNLPNDFLLCYNLGTSDFMETLKLTTQLGYSFTNQFYTFFEYYAVFGKEAPSHNVNGGFLFGFTSDFQLDISSGCSVFNSKKDWFVSAGISYRFF